VSADFYSISGEETEWFIFYRVHVIIRKEGKGATEKKKREWGTRLLEAFDGRRKA